jgi:periplasmic divalent cation tolerance protein
MNRFIDVLVTCPDRAVAEAIARACVEARLAACANIGGEIASIYRWKGAIEQAGEVPLFLKTRAQLFEKLAARVKSLHPYEVPCVVATELTHLDPAYAKWLEDETEA